MKVYMCIIVALFISPFKSFIDITISKKYHQFVVFSRYSQSASIKTMYCCLFSLFVFNLFTNGTEIAYNFDDKALPMASIQNHKPMMKLGLPS